MLNKQDHFKLLSFLLRIFSCLILTCLSSPLIISKAVVDVVGSLFHSIEISIFCAKQIFGSIASLFPSFAFICFLITEFICVIY